MTSMTKMASAPRLVAVIGSVALLALGACGGGSSSADGAGIDAIRVDSAGGVDAIANAMPALLSVQRDRAGRPAVSTALIAPFQGDADMKDAAKGAYNAARTAAEWQGFVPGLAASMAVIDALDTHLASGGCDTQPLYNPAEGTPTSGYVRLAAALADDRIYVDTTQDACSIYLGVEAFALALTETRTCGGRVPAVLAVTQDPVDMSYAILAGGLVRIGVVTDGIAEDDQQATVSNDTFPFLAAPTPP